LLGHFLAHYRTAGVADFFVAVDPRFERAVTDFAYEYNIKVISDLDVADTVIGEVSAVTEMRRRHQHDTEWVIIVDLDEFVEFRGSIQQIITRAEGEGANLVTAIMWDRFSLDGRVRGFRLDDDVAQIYPIRARFIRDVMFGCDIKGVLVKGLLASNCAHHTFKSEIICSEVPNISHYKWTEGSIDRLKSAYRMVISAGRSFGDEYARILDHYERNGRFAWEEFGGEPIAAPRSERRGGL
jgi:hypothetical protein